MTTLIERNLQTASQEQQALYDHLLDCVKTESPEEVIHRYYCLFIQGTGYSDPEIRNILDRMISTRLGEQEFKSVLNRCWYIAINRWQMHPLLRSAIPELVGLLERLPPTSGNCSPRSRRLRQLVKSFVETEQYVKLRLLAQLNDPSGKASGSRRLGTLISRYPYLYEHCLLSEDSDYEYRQSIWQIRSQTQRRFELDLSQYVTYQVRLAQVYRRELDLTTAKRIVQPVKNPTLLSNSELNAALTHFVGNIQGNYTYKDLARQFTTHSAYVPSFRAYKDDLYEYLVSSVEPKYGKRQFNQRLYQQIHTTLPQCDSQKPDEFLIIRTANRLLRFLVIESYRSPNHYTFIDLITNLGPTSTVGLLLKIVLLCNKVKPYLEKQFSVLFSHYESAPQNGVSWLVKALENLHLAFTVYFGKADFSYLRQLT